MTGSDRYFFAPLNFFTYQMKIKIDSFFGGDVRLRPDSQAFVPALNQSDRVVERQKELLNFLSCFPLIGWFVLLLPSLSVR